MTHLDSVTDASFSEQVGPGSGVVAVDFWAPWCGPCRAATPVLKEVAEEFADRVEVRAMDVDLNPVTASRHGIRGLPTVVFFRDGAEVGRAVGALPKRALRQRFEEALRVGA